VLLFIWTEGRAQGKDSLSIFDIIELAHQQSTAFKKAATEKETNFWKYQYFKAGYNPQLVLEGNIPTYSQSYISVVQPDGSIAYRSINQTNPGLNLSLQQPITWSGGTISANTNLYYFNSAMSPNQWSGTLFNLQLNQPLFGFNKYKWDKKIQPIVFEESEKVFAEEKEEISREAVKRFFALLKAQVNLKVAKFNLANNDTIFKIEQGRYAIGTTTQDNLFQVELQLLRSRQDVAKANLEFKTSRLAIQAYVGISNMELVSLIEPDDIPQFEISAEEAIQYSRQNRAAYVALERRRLEAERDVAQAKSNRFSTSLSASYGLNNSGYTTKDIYSDPLKQQTFNLSLYIPVLNWGRNHAMMKTAYASKRLNDYIILQDEQNFEQTILTHIEQFDLLRPQIEITRTSDDIAQQRYLITQKRYIKGKVDITNLNIAMKEKDDAKKAYIEALESFWMSYFELRRLILYDFFTGRSLYK
jgi:outer membrane protein TolC